MNINIYIRIRNMIREESYERYLLILAMPKFLHNKLFALTALHLELQKCLCYNKTPFVSEMRITWWREQLERGSTSNDILVCWKNDIKFSSKKITDAFCQAIYENRGAFFRLSIICDAYIEIWYQLIFHKKENHALDVAKKCCTYWAYWKLMHNNFLTKYGYFNHELVIHDGKIIDQLWRNMNYHEKKDIRMFYILKCFGDLYQEQNQKKNFLLQAKLYWQLFCIKLTNKYYVQMFMC